MQSTPETEARSERASRIPEAKRELAKFRDHLGEIVESPAFRGSHRSAQFLRFICEQAISGNVESLKERAIGVELFGRAPAYDTGEDAIVRVAASDVRKRLSNFYLSNGRSSPELRISLPVGSYIPEFIRDLPESIGPPAAPAIPDTVPADALSVPASDAHPASPSLSTSPGRWFWISIALGIACLALLGLLWRAGVHPTPPARAALLPWSAIFSERRAPLLITSDPNIAEIQGLTNQPVSASDYANQKYIPNPGVLSPLLIHICRDVLRGDKAANVDTPILSAVAGLAAENSARIHVRPARDLHFSDFDTDGSLIFLGSPRTDPWVSLFNDQMDFRFGYDDASRQEIIENVRPHAGEPGRFIPTAKGFATGQSFAIVAFVRNPNHAGHILILAGANAEGTRAAGEFVTSTSGLSSTLQRCGVHSSTSPPETVQHFEVLLRVLTMAGSPTAFDVAACHLLP